MKEWNTEKCNMKNAPHEKSGTQGKTVQCGKNLIGKIEHGKSEYWKYSQE